LTAGWSAAALIRVTVLTERPNIEIVVRSKSPALRRIVRVPRFDAEALARGFVEGWVK
jgi:hypothetical protein